MLEGEPDGGLEARQNKVLQSNLVTKGENEELVSNYCSAVTFQIYAQVQFLFRFDIFDIYLGNPAKHGEAESDLLSRILRQMFRDVDRRRGRVGANAPAVAPA